MSRQEGFYWVKIKDDIGTKWENLVIGRYNGDKDADWDLPGSDSIHYTCELVILSDRLEEPK